MGVTSCWSMPISPNSLISTPTLLTMVEKASANHVAFSGVIGMKSMILRDADLRKKILISLVLIILYRIGALFFL